MRGRDGFPFPVKVCIVGIVTCNNDDYCGRKLAMINTSFSNVFNVFGTNNRYSLPSPFKDFKVKRKYFDPERQLFEAVGGNNDAKKALEDVLDEKKRFTLSKFGLSLPSGVLLYGPPGTGKTLTAKAISEVTNGTFISVKASDIVCSEIGKSEKLLSSLFESARKRKTVIFIDEFQALFTERGKGSGRLVSTLLALMDDISKWQDATLSVGKVTGNHLLENRVVLLAATNTPVRIMTLFGKFIIQFAPSNCTLLLSSFLQWMVDRAFLRSGRFDRVSVKIYLASSCVEI